MKRIGWATILCTVFLSGAARAQEHPNGFYLTSPLNLSSGYDDNFPTDTRILDDNVTTLTAPTFAWLKSTRRSTFSIDYRPEFELFTHHSDLDAWNHLSNMRFTHQISGRLSLEGGDYFLSTMDPARALSNSLLLLPRGRFLQNSFYTGLRYRLDHRTDVSVRLDNGFTNATLPGALDGRLDQVSTAGSVTLHRILSRRQKLTANYSFLHVHPFDRKLAGSPTNVNLFSLGYTYEINPKLVIQLFGGGVQGPEPAFIGAVSVAKKIRNIWLLAGYQRYLSFFGGLTPAVAPPVGINTPDGLTPNSIYQVISFRAWGHLTRRLSIDANGQRALNGVDQRNRNIKSAIGQVRLSYGLTDRLAFFTQAEFYGQNVNEFSPFPESRRRYTAGIEVVISRPPLSESLQRRREPPKRDRDDELEQENDAAAEESN